MEHSAAQNHPEITFGSFLKAAGEWVRKNPLSAVLTVTLLLVVSFFYYSLPLYANRSISAARWAWESWNAEGNMEHAKLVPAIFLFLLWYHRDRLADAPKRSSLKGLWIFVAGIACFVLSVRTLQPRLALLAMPFLVLGGAWFLYGSKVARILLFPSVFLLFTINSAVIEQATFKLQFVITHAVGVLSNLIGVKIAAIGTTLTAADGAFNFEIAEGCSGIRSLIAMCMITALYVHLTQTGIWRKLIIFAASILFAVIGNIGRIFTVVLFARFIDKDIAAGLYHDWSGFIFFPFALGAMVLFAKLLEPKTAARAAHDESDGVKTNGGNL